MPDLTQCLDDVRDFLEAADDAHLRDVLPYLEDIAEAADGLVAVTEHLTAPAVADG